MGIKIIHLLAAGQVTIARERDYLHVGTHHEEGHVETYLVIARPGRAVSDGVRADLVGIAGDGDALENALGRDGDGVNVIAEDVAIDHELQTLVVIFTRHVEGDVLRSAELVGILFVLLELFGGKAASIGTGGIYFIALLASQIHNGV